MTSPVAVVLCVHHKPWLVMSTLVTLALQDFQDFDLHVVFNVGDGRCPGRASYEPYRRLLDASRQAPSPDVERASYGRYDRLAREAGLNAKLSAFDERLRAVCGGGWPRVTYRDFENDHALDSGVWYKVIRSGLGEKYDHVVFAQEGTLFTRQTALGAAVEFARAGADFIAAGHFKRRLPRADFLRYNTRQPDPTPLDVFHDQMIAATFDVFRRDPDFDAAYASWGDDFAVGTEHHLPDIWGGWLSRRLRNAADSRAPLSRGPLKRGAAAFLRRHRGAFARMGRAAAEARVGLARLAGVRWEVASRGADDAIWVDSRRRRVGDLVAVTERDGVKFHRAEGAEWFGCSCNHLLSRGLLDRLSLRLDKHRLWDALDLPFAGTGLEVAWGLMPPWLGVDKWFFDGMHRVFKHPATYRREDEPAELADYVNRYYPGRVAVKPRGDFLAVTAASEPHASRLRALLDRSYF